MMRMLFAGFVGAFIGLLQQAAMLFYDLYNTAQHEQPHQTSRDLDSDFVFYAFAVAVSAEVVCVMALYMYRIAPWICRLLGANWEAQQILAAKKINEGQLTGWITFLVLTRRGVLFAAGVFSYQAFAWSLVAFLPLLIPRYQKRILN